jgi:hypothetical protein
MLKDTACITDSIVPVTLTELASNAAWIFALQTSTIVVAAPASEPPVVENRTLSNLSDRRIVRAVVGRKARIGIMSVQHVNMYKKKEATEPPMRRFMGRKWTN